MGVRDSVLRENGNIYDPQVDEIVDDIINNHGGVCPCGCGTVYQSRDYLVSLYKFSRCFCANGGNCVLDGAIEFVE